MADASVTLRDRLAWLTFPVLMGGFVVVAAWGLGRGYDPVRWGAGLTVVNFFVILGVEQVLPRNPAMNVFRDRQSLNDVGHGMLLAALGRPLGGAASIGVMAMLAQLRGASGLASAWPDAWPFAAQMLPALLIWTFSDYWIHRSLHTFDRLWWFHSVHHDTPQMHILKSGRIHVGEELFNAVLKPIPLLLLGAPPEIVVFVGLWIVFDGNLVHSNIDQRFPGWAHYFLPTVQLHNLHHAKDRRHQDSNYSGSSAIWDVLFGTFSHPHRCPLGPLGLEDSPVPRGFLAQLVFPLRAQVATLAVHGPPASRTS
jgi:sterol desaturase/sphingolipid hydroxylase (fatty acid hydroxylase superfamily)